MKLRLPAHIDLSGLSKTERFKTVARWFFTSNRMAILIAGMFSAWVGLSWIVLVLERNEPLTHFHNFGDALWWGLTTMTTVGYGDLVPHTAGGRVAAGLLMLAGVACIGIITAKISAHFLKQVLLEGRGFVDKSKVRDHVVICGWKDDMADLLRHVLQVNHRLRAQDIVVVANKSPEDVAALKADPKLGNITVIIGDYFHQSTLVRAAPEAARKVLILADSSTAADGRKPSATEADARTIMTAIALSNIAKGTVVAAEIVDPSLDHYLKMAGVGEIVYPREFSRLLLGSASSGLGLVNVFQDLADPRTGSFITTHALPSRFVDMAYGLFRGEFERLHPDMLVIGIMENTGNPHSIKEMAFKEAQKTPSIGRLIENLRTVKSLRCNNPVFHPREDYRIGKGAAAIVLVNEHAATQTLHQDFTDKDTVAA